MSERPWLERFEKSIEEHVDGNTREKVLQDSGDIAGAVERLEAEAGKDVASRVLECCACDNQIHVEKARKLYEKTGRDMDAFIKLLIRDTAIFGRMEREGDVVNVIYPRCVCYARMVAGMKSPALCNCGNGYVRQLFEGALGRPVRVELVESIAAGDEECRFAVHLPE